MWTPLTQNIFNALQELLRACNLSGESGTEELYEMLHNACQELEAERTLQQSHDEGLCYDMNAALATKLEGYLTAASAQGH